ncbi:hypothetical protein ALO56_200087 [Pseudomonas viridiflava]|nr:hypothetical protein ALO56_200087 [Pseudomonas viridiflava]
MFGHVTGKTVRVETQRFRQHVQGATGTQGTEQHGVAQVGGDGRDQRHARLGSQLQPVQQTPHVTGQRAVADQYALGPAGGTGGVDNVGRRLGGKRRVEGSGWQILPHRRRPTDALTTLDFQRLGPRIAFGTQHYSDFRIDKHLLQARIRCLHIQRHVNATGLEDRQH